MIGQMELCNVTPGSLWRLFASGHVAVQVHCPDLLSSLWHELMEQPEEQLPWQAPLVTIARNYHGSGDITSSLGDLFYFQKNRHGYIARKIALARKNDTGSIIARPSYFHQNERRYATPQRVLERCWNLGRQLMEAISPEGSSSPPFEIAIQRLKYQESINDFCKLEALSQNSLGRWGRAGCAIDEKRSEAAGILSRRGWSDLYGLMMHIPVIRTMAKWFNEKLLQKDPVRNIDPERRIIEGAHVDYRYFTALCGHRKTTLTQVFSNGKWQDLAIDLNSIVVFPGTLANEKFGSPQVLHRVLHLEGNEAKTKRRNPRLDDVTLLIGAA